MLAGFDADSVFMLGCKMAIFAAVAPMRVVER